MNFIAKQTGKAIGKSFFNNQTTSCDGMNSKGEACCYERKEAKAKKMIVCKEDKFVLGKKISDPPKK